MVNLDYLYNPDTKKPYLNMNYFSDKKLSFRVIENGTILPHKKVIIPKSKSFWSNHLGGIADSKGKFIKESYVHYGVGNIYTPPRINAIQF